MGARGLLADLVGAGFQVTVGGNQLVIRPWSKLTYETREALRHAKPELLVLLREVGPATEVGDPAIVVLTDGDIDRLHDRLPRLLRRGWAEPEARSLAERLAKRDRERDERVCCADCVHYRPGRCGNHRRAALNVPQVGSDLASLLQHCPGFGPLKDGA